MKTLLLTCVSCILLAGVYLTLTNKSAMGQLLTFTKTNSAALTAVPVVQEETEVKPNLDAETSLAPVETLPAETTTLPILNTTVDQPVIVAANPVAPVVPTAEVVDSNFIDYTVFEKEADAVATAFARVTEIEAAAQVIEPETEATSYVHVPFMEEQEEAVEDSELESRRLMIKLNPGNADSAARFTAPVKVTGSSLNIAAPVTEKLVTTAVQNETKASVMYTPSHLVNAQGETGRESYSYTLLYDRAERIKAYAARKGFDTAFAFMIDMGMKSGKKRFFVMDLNNMTIVKRGIVAHGRGGSAFTFDKNYSNTGGSNCTSLGIYKIGAPYKGNYGASYKLMGLESSNSNALNRSIILHGMSCIPYDESEAPICQSEGCPSLSPAFLKEIAPIINSRSKPMLLWIYDPLSENVEEQMVSNN